MDVTRRYTRKRKLLLKHQNHTIILDKTINKKELFISSLDIEQRLNNPAPKIVTLYVNKTTCSNCRSYQIELAQALNIPKLIMINPNGMQFLYNSNEYYYYYYFKITDKEIIKFYYPDSKIIKLKNAGVI